MKSTHHERLPAAAATVQPQRPCPQFSASVTVSKVFTSTENQTSTLTPTDQQCELYKYQPKPNRCETIPLQS